MVIISNPQQANNHDQSIFTSTIPHQQKHVGIKKLFTNYEPSFMNQLSTPNSSPFRPLLTAPNHRQGKCGEKIDKGAIRLGTSSDLGEYDIAGTPGRAPRFPHAGGWLGFVPSQEPAGFQLRSVGAMT